MNTKSTCLFMITVKRPDETVENIVFAYFKEVFEIPPSETYFYNNYGDKGIAHKLLEIEKVEFSQWFCILSPSEVENCYNTLISGKVFNIGTIPTYFQLDAIINPILEDEPYNKLKAIPTCSEYQIERYSYSHYKYLDDIHFDFFKGDIVSNLPSKGEYSQYIFPYGFIGLNELNNHLLNNTVIQKTNLFFVHHFRGEHSGNKKSDEDPRKFIGYVDYCSIERNNLLVSILPGGKDINGDVLKVKVDKNTGIWIYESEVPIGKGIIVYYDSTNEQAVAGEEFTLIKSFSVNVVPVTQIAKDLYGNPVYRAEKSSNLKKIEYTGDRTWYRESFPALSDEIYQQKISNYLKNIIIYCAPKIIFYDPYCLGEIKAEKGLPKINPSQRIVVNALINALAETEINEIGFCCMKRRVKGFWQDPSIVSYGYRLLFDQLKSIRPVKFSFRIFDGIFHNRHIVNFDQKHTISLSTSLNGLITEDELEVRELFGEEKNKINSRIKKIWDKSAQSEVTL